MTTEEMLKRIEEIKALQERASFLVTELTESIMMEAHDFCVHPTGQFMGSVELYTLTKRVGGEYYPVICCNKLARINAYLRLRHIDDSRVYYSGVKRRKKAPLKQS